MLRDCIVIAIEGTHASGKTTLTHALAAYYRERGIHVATVEEPARHSPFIEEIVVHGKGTFDLETEAVVPWASLAPRASAYLIPDLSRVTSRGPSHNSTSRLLTH